MTPANLTILWRIALVAGVSALLAHSLWVVVHVQSGTFGDGPEWVSDGLGIASLVGMIVVAVAVVKSRRPASSGRGVVAAEGQVGTYRPRLPAPFDWVVWLYLPVTIFSGLIIAVTLDLTWMLAGFLVVALILGWPVLLVVRGVRYEITDQALVIRQVGRRVSLAWSDIAEVTTTRVPFGEQLLITTRAGRTERLGAPEDRDGFLRALRGRAPDAHIEGGDAL